MENQSQQDNASPLRSVGSIGRTPMRQSPFRNSPVAYRYAINQRINDARLTLSNVAGLGNSQATPGGSYISPSRRRLMRSNNSPSSGVISSPSTVVSALTPQARARRPLLFNRQTAPNLNEDSERLEQEPSTDPLKILLENETRNSNDIQISPKSVRNRRGDIHSSIRLPLLNNVKDNNQMNIGDKIKERKNQIWGTNVQINDVQNSFEDFLLNFKLLYRKQKEGFAITEIDKRPFYQLYIKKIEETQIFKLNLDIQNLLAYEPSKKLYFQLVNFPQEIIPIFDDVLTLVYKRIHKIKDPHGAISLKVRPFNLGKSTNMRELNPSDIDKIVSTKGLIIRSSPILPEMSVASFRCSICDSTVEVEVDRGKIDEPSKCSRRDCNSSNTMMLIHNRSSFKDRQICRLQETPDSIPDGQTPHSVSLCLYDDLVDTVRPGDKVELTAIYRSAPIRVHPRTRTIKALFKTYLDVVHVAKFEQNRTAADSTDLGFDNFDSDEDGDINISEKVLMSDDQPEIDIRMKTSSEKHENRPEFTEEEIRCFNELSKRQDLYEYLARSLAPSIFGLDDIKKGILLQLFGGTNKKFEKSGSPRYRGDINVLLVGDPGTAKSQMLQYVHKIAPRGIYTSGKGSSAVGLTAYVTRDPDTKQMVLESGALVLSDGGVCCIDEFDKMSDGTRAILHEAMEQQTVSVAKAGIITTLNARASILASANPVDSKYNPRLSIVKNIDLPPTLMSRFDLIYLVVDKTDERADRRLANHLVSLYLEDSPFTAGIDILPVKTLTKYIRYARKKFHPIIGDDESANALVTAYVNLRKRGINPRTSEVVITATTRQLESMIRLSEAHARMRLSDKVKIIDVREAERLLKEAIQLAAFNPETGQIDMDMITTGFSSSERRLMEDMRRELREMFSRIDSDTITWRKAFEDFKAQSYEAI
ncbi:6177_t:CDS:10 [Diversispora eburnea]|uniref:DNA replication licensing factor MCM4 n=1 Tax=Diversispora eburnea TaxID=1213867 RepID=A0A9N9G6F2_9GLOM|nr:6177_t:CDS:10 [Diversispora eburnea]